MFISFPADTRIRLLKSSQHGGGIIRAGIVDNDQLKLLERLGHEALHRLTQEAPAIVSRHQNAKPRDTTAGSAEWFVILPHQPLMHSDLPLEQTVVGLWGSGSTRPSASLIRVSAKTFTGSGGTFAMTIFLAARPIWRHSSRRSHARSRAWSKSTTVGAAATKPVTSSSIISVLPATSVTMPMREQSIASTSEIGSPSRREGSTRPWCSRHNRSMSSTCPRNSTLVSSSKPTNLLRFFSQGPLPKRLTFKLRCRHFGCART